MSFKIVIYVVTLLLSTFAVSGINFNYFLKKDHIWEARFLAIILILSLSYLSTNFVINFIGEIGI